MTSFLLLLNKFSFSQGVSKKISLYSESHLYGTYAINFFEYLDDRLNCHCRYISPKDTFEIAIAAYYTLHSNRFDSVEVDMVTGNLITPKLRKCIIKQTKRLSIEVKPANNQFKFHTENHKALTGIFVRVCKGKFIQDVRQDDCDGMFPH